MVCWVAINLASERWERDVRRLPGKRPVKFRVNGDWSLRVRVWRWVVGSLGRCGAEAVHGLKFVVCSESLALVGLDPTTFGL